MSEKTPALAKVLRETLLEISSSLGVAARDGNNSHVTGAGTCIGKVVGQLFICGNMTSHHSTIGRRHCLCHSTILLHLMVRDCAFLTPYDRRM